MNRLTTILLSLCVLSLIPARVQAKIQTEFGDSTKTHVFTLGAQLMTRGEYIQGAVQNPDETMAAFVLERTRLILNYKQPYLEVQIIPQHLGVWGTSGGGSFNLREAWAQTDVKGFFAKLGRQTLSYDDERIMGLNDWSMTSAYHDALKLGYEGFGHKIHVMGAYCQNNGNMLGGTMYIGGVQPYKNMEALWYHYDFKRWFSASLMFINTGMQSCLTTSTGETEKKTYYQQMAGTYWHFRYDGPTDWWIDADASFYYQFGTTEYRLPLSAWMLAVEAKAQANKWTRFRAGYFYLSGDENYTVPPPGGIGMQQLTHDHSFNLLYGSKHQFYGAMDFFYLQTFYGGYSPGLQDVHGSASFVWNNQFEFEAAYHALATTVDVNTAPGRLLGHELELKAQYKPVSWVTISANYTFMQGTKTMEIVKRSSDRNQSHWVYLMVTLNPTFVKVRF